MKNTMTQALDIVLRRGALFLRRTGNVPFDLNGSFLGLGAAFSMMGAAHAAEVEPSGIAIEIMLPPDWANTSTTAKVCVTDGTGGGFASVEVRVDRGGSWRNITASMERRDSRYYGTVDITSNCTVYVRVTGHDGQIYENSRYMECFDTTPPTLRASVSGDVLQVEAADDLSGVAHITVNGTCYPNLTGNAVDVPLKDLGTSEQFTVQAADKAGNYSRRYQVKNPNYKSPATNTTTPSKTAPSTTTPPSGSASVTTDTEQTVKPLTPDGQGTVVDNVTDQDSKEFFTFTTPNENTFYGTPLSDVITDPRLAPERYADSPDAPDWTRAVPAADRSEPEQSKAGTEILPAQETVLEPTGAGAPEQPETPAAVQTEPNLTPMWTNIWI